MVLAKTLVILAFIGSSLADLSCPQSPYFFPTDLSHLPSCESDDDCAENELCCYWGVADHNLCKLGIDSTPKDGMCAAGDWTDEERANAHCAADRPNECLHDSQCDGDKKCCSSICGRLTCQHSVSVSQAEPLPRTMPDYLDCPAWPYYFPNTGSMDAETVCESHSDCPQSKYCCYYGHENGVKVCKSGIDKTAREGECPAASFTEQERADAECAMDHPGCRYDSECAGSEKCCQTVCGGRCQSVSLGGNIKAQPMACPKMACNGVSTFRELPAKCRRRGKYVKKETKAVGDSDEVCATCYKCKIRRPKPNFRTQMTDLLSRLRSQFKF